MTFRILRKNNFLTLDFHVDGRAPDYAARQRYSVYRISYQASHGILSEPRASEHDSDVQWSLGGRLKTKFLQGFTGYPRIPQDFLMQLRISKDRAIETFIPVSVSFR